MGEQNQRLRSQLGHIRTSLLKAMLLIWKSHDKSEKQCIVLSLKAQQRMEPVKWVMSLEAQQPESNVEKGVRDG